MQQFDGIACGVLHSQGMVHELDHVPVRVMNVGVVTVKVTLDMVLPPATEWKQARCPGHTNLARLPAAEGGSYWRGNMVSKHVSVQVKTLLASGFCFPVIIGIDVDHLI